MIDPEDVDKIEALTSTYFLELRTKPTEMTRALEAATEEELQTLAEALCYSVENANNGQRALLDLKAATILFSMKAAEDHAQYDYEIGVL